MDMFVYKFNINMMFTIFSASQPAVITSTTIEVVVPQSLVPSLYGEDEFCINKIREV